MIADLVDRVTNPREPTLPLDRGGRYAHASTRMRDDLKVALQARWEDSLRARAAISPHSPVPLLDELLAPFSRQQPPAA